jgi:phage-related protein
VVTGETRYVASITDNTHLTVSVAFSDNANDTSPDRLRDACSKTFAACLLHNNTLRFGGFPSVPSKKTFLK